MKQVKHKYIRLTETQLNNIIKDEVEKQIAYLLEYAEPRKDFVNKCSNHYKQILENWCLCRYCTLTKTDINRCHNHWRNELTTQLSTIADMQIKKNNSDDAKRKAIIEGFDKADAFNGVDFNFNKIIGKFVNEGINCKDILIKQAVSDFCNEIDNIIQLLVENNGMNIATYAHSI